MEPRIEDLKRQIRIMEWDQSRNQLNANKVVYLNRLREELGVLQQQQSPELEEQEISEEEIS